MPSATYTLTPHHWLIHDEDTSFNQQRLESQIEAGWYLPKLGATIKATADYLEFTDPDAQKLLRELGTELAYVHEHYSLQPRRRFKRNA